MMVAEICGFAVPPDQYRALSNVIAQLAREVVLPSEAVDCARAHGAVVLMERLPREATSCYTELRVGAPAIDR